MFLNKFDVFYPPPSPFPHLLETPLSHPCERPCECHLFNGSLIPSTDNFILRKYGVLTDVLLLFPGAYGVVNLVIERTTGRDYACKVLPKQRGKLKPEKLARKILTEVELLNRVQVRARPHIIPTTCSYYYCFPTSGCT